MIGALAWCAARAAIAADAPSPTPAPVGSQAQQAMDYAQRGDSKLAISVANAALAATRVTALPLLPARWRSTSADNRKTACDAQIKFAFIHGDSYLAICRAVHVKKIVTRDSRNIEVHVIARHAETRDA